MGEEQLIHEKRDSIEMSRNAKGDIAWKVKLCFDNDSQGCMVTIEHIEAIHCALEERFL